MNRPLIRLAAGFAASLSLWSHAFACERANVVHLSSSWQSLELSNGTEWRVQTGAAGFALREMPIWQPGDVVAVCASKWPSIADIVIVRLSDLSHVTADLTYKKD